MVGVSASTAEEVRAAAESGVADLVGIGPVWATPTKTDAAAPLGPEGLAALAGPARAAGLVAVGIGGIRADRLPLLRAAGADGICVVSAIAASENPRAAARELRAAAVDEGVLAAAGSAAPAARSEGAAS